jgi:hypothetical protein
VILGFWGFFIVAHLVGDAGAPSRPLRFGDYLVVSTMGVSLLGLGLALRWEKLGAGLALTAAAISVLVSWKLLFFPPAFVPALLFLCHSQLAESARRSPAFQGS